MFKIGDKVKVIKETWGVPSFVGKEGTVISIFNDDVNKEADCRVSFDEVIYVKTSMCSMEEVTYFWENDETGEFYNETWSFNIRHKENYNLLEYDILERIVPTQKEFDF